MNLDEVRASFTVYLIASRLARFEGIADTLGLAGYMAASFTELTAAFSEFPSNPPQLLIFDAEESAFDVAGAIGQVNAQLKSSHVFLFTPIERRHEFVPWLERGVYDLILAPLTTPLDVLKPLDRAAERDSYMYQNERLLEAQSAPSSAAEAHSTVVTAEPSDVTSYIQDMFNATAPDACVDVYLRHATQATGAAGAIYFQYIANRRVLLAKQATRLEGVELGRLGIDFNSADPPLKSAVLKTPENLDSLRDLLRDVFGVTTFSAHAVEALGEVRGIAVFLKPAPSPSAAFSRDALTLLNKALSLLEADRRLHATAIKDPLTELLNRPNFMTKIAQEVSRARRNQLPVSLLKIAVDPFQRVYEQLGPEESATLVKVVARIVEKQSRVNDVLGRTGMDEISVGLVDTDRKGAMIKAERLRKLIAAADFSKVLAAFPRVTLSIGISEYPSLVRDAEELVGSADEALFAARAQTNSTCLAAAPPEFKPDFAVDVSW